VDRAAALARTHALPGYDAVQLAAALEVHALAPSLTLLSADAGLSAAAAAEGLSVDDPNHHPYVYSSPNRPAPTAVGILLRTRERGKA
jgi:hypothetical protein